MMKYLDIRELQPISVQTELSVLHLECDMLALHTHSVLTKGNNIMIEVPLKVAKCLFFFFFSPEMCYMRSSLGKRKPRCLFWKVYILQHSESTSLISLR